MKIILAVILTFCYACSTTSMERYHEVVDFFSHKGYQVLSISTRGDDFSVTLKYKNGPIRCYDVYRDGQGTIKTSPELE